MVRPEWWMKLNGSTAEAGRLLRPRSKLPATDASDGKSLACGRLEVLVQAVKTGLKPKSRDSRFQRSIGKGAWQR